MPLFPDFSVFMAFSFVFAWSMIAGFEWLNGEVYTFAPLNYHSETYQSS